MYLKKSDVLKIIASEPEYPDGEKFLKRMEAEIKEFPGTSDDLATALAEMVLYVARMAVRRTKEEITKNINSTL